MATQRLRDQLLFPEVRADVHVHGLFVTGMNPLYNAAVKHFRLTSLFSFNINFYILYPQLYSTVINHINHLQEVLTSL